MQNVREGREHISRKTSSATSHSTTLLLPSSVSMPVASVQGRLVVQSLQPSNFPDAQAALVNHPHTRGCSRPRVAPFPAARLPRAHLCCEDVQRPPLANRLPPLYGCRWRALVAGGPSPRASPAGGRTVKSQAEEFPASPRAWPQSVRGSPPSHRMRLRVFQALVEFGVQRFVGYGGRTSSVVPILGRPADRSVTGGDARHQRTGEGIQQQPGAAWLEMKIDGGQISKGAVGFAL